MVVTLTQGADDKAVERALVGLGLWPERLASAGARAFAVAAHSMKVMPETLRAIAGVAEVFVHDSRHPRVDALVGSRAVAALLGDAQPVLMAGPCSVESEAQIDSLAGAVRKAGATYLRGGAFKPRSSPYGFQGAGAVALDWLALAAKRHGLKVVTEALSERDVELVAERADLVQVGSRNMQNFALLKEVGRSGRPVLLKRGVASTVEEWLLAGEYCLTAGASAVLFCERGIRSFDGATRNLLDLSTVALLAHVYGLSVIVDPSHAAGRRDLIAPLSRAAIAAGAVGLIIEVHDDPPRALSDGPQALLPQAFAALTQSLKEGVAHGNHS